MRINDPKGIDSNHQISSTDINRIGNIEMKKKLESRVRINSKTGEDKVNRCFEEDLYSSRVNNIKRQIEAGEYKISSASIPKKMLDKMEEQRGIDN